MTEEISLSAGQEISIVIGFVCSIFSLIGALFTIFVYWLVPTTRKNFFFFLAFHLAISDFGVAITGMTLTDPTEIDKNYCNILATIRGFSIMSSFITNFMIALFIYRAVLTDNYLQNFSNQKAAFLVSNYAFSLFGSIGPYLSGVYGPSNIYCWIRVDKKSYLSIFWMTCEAYIALPLTLLWVILIYCWVISHLKRMVSRERQSDVHKLGMVPLVFVITNGVTLLDILVETYFGKKLGINLVHICLRQLQGFFHAVVYASGIVKEEIKKKWKERKPESTPLVSTIEIEDYITVQTNKQL